MGCRRNRSPHRRRRDDGDVELQRQLHQPLIEIEPDGERGRVGGEVHHHAARARLLPHRMLEPGEQIYARSDRHRAQGGAGEDLAEGMDRIAGVRRHHHVARRHDRLGEVGEALLRPEGDDHLGLGIERDVEAALVVAGEGAAQARDAARGRVAVDLGVVQGLDQLLHHVRRRRPVGVAHAEVDDVLAAPPGGCLHRVHFREHVGRQSTQAEQFLGHAYPPGR